MRIGSLFSGIGGLELGLERSGLGHTVWQVECDARCRAVLARHWPDAERFEDVRTCNPGPIDLICGGFPCQDVSSAGKRAGLAGARSGLWFEYLRIVGSYGQPGSWSSMSPAERVRGLTSWSTGWNSKGTRAFRSRLRQRMLAHRMNAREFSSLLPTLTKTGNMLCPSMQKWPAHRLLPTLSRASYGSNKGGAAGRQGESRPSLQTIALRLLPTLTRRDSKGPGPAHTKGGRDMPTEAGGHLNPTWCEWFMGFPEGWTLIDQDRESPHSATP